MKFTLVKGRERVDITSINPASHDHHKHVLTQNVHPAPYTQQAEQSWLHTRKE
jgi:hypothetical protein